MSRKPCHECAFRRDIKPGTLGGSPPETYVGQSEGPFYVPCHICYGDDPNWKTNIDKPQCAGVAVYRANLGIPVGGDFLLKLPTDTENVFATHAEFLAHHKQISLESAKLELVKTTPQEHLRNELVRAGVAVHLVPRK